MQVAIPEFDGRLDHRAVLLQGDGADGIPVYVADPERAARVAGIAVRHARLRHVPQRRQAGRRGASAPTRPSTPGSATPSGWTPRPRRSGCCAALREAGYDLGDAPPPDDGDALIHALIAAGGHDVEWLTEEQLAAAAGPGAAGRLPALVRPAARPSCASAMREHWGEPPGELYIDGGDIVLAGLRFGNVVLMIQPPRGFGENPIAIYHDPDLPPSPPLPGRVPLAGAPSRRRLRRRRRRAPGQARHPGVAARQGPRPVRGLRARRGPRRPAAGLPVHRQRPRRGHPGQAARRTPRSSTTWCRRWPAPTPTATWPSWSSCSTSTPPCRRSTRPRCPPCGRRSGRWSRPPSCTTTCTSTASPTRTTSTSSCCTSTATCARSRTCRSATGCTSSATRPTGEARVNLVLAVLRAPQIWGGARRPARPAAGARRRVLGLDEQELLASPGQRLALPAALTDVVDGPAGTAADAIDLHGGARPAAGRSAWRRWTGTPTTVDAVVRGGDRAADPGRRRGAALRRHRAGAPTGPRPPTRSTNILRALDGGYVAGRPVRLTHPRPGQRAADRPQLLLRRPEGHPQPQRLGRRRGPRRLAAGPAPRRHRGVPALGRA